LGQRGGKIENHIIAVMVIFCIPYKRICPNFRHSCKDYGHHLSPHWYDIVHFGPKPS
jgi:hypothetical protein